METYQQFKIINLKFDEGSKESWQILWKPHIVREYNERKPGGRTLFIVNLPSFITKESLKEMMERFGNVNDVFLQNKPSLCAPPDVKYPLLSPEIIPKGYKVGYVVFNESNSLALAMDFPSTDYLFASTKTQIATGLKKWFEEYNSSFKPEETLREEIKMIMEDYDTSKELKKKTKMNWAQPDDEGWVTVVSRRKRIRAASLQGRTSRQPKRSRKKKVVLVNFYNFQKADDNRKQMEEKRKKFEEDGRRMALLRSARKFRPLS